jgi:hypothetical protein
MSKQARRKRTDQWLFVCLERAAPCQRLRWSQFAIGGERGGSGGGGCGSRSAGRTVTAVKMTGCRRGSATPFAHIFAHLLELRHDNTTATHKKTKYKQSQETRKMSISVLRRAEQVALRVRDYSELLQGNKRADL